MKRSVHQLFLEKIPTHSGEDEPASHVLENINLPLRPTCKKRNKTEPAKSSQYLVMMENVDEISKANPVESRGIDSPERKTCSILEKTPRGGLKNVPWAYPTTLI